MASAIALHQLITVFATVGLDQAVVLQRVEDADSRRARGLIAWGMVIPAALTLVLAATGPIWSPALGFDGFDRLVVVTLLWTVPAVSVQLAMALLMGEDRLGSFAAVSLLSTIGSQAVGLLLLFTVQRDVLTYAWGGVVGQTAAMVVGLIVVRPHWRGIADLPTFRHALDLGVPLMLSGVSVIVLSSGDRLVIQRVLGSEEAGRYQVAYTVGFVAVMVVTMTGQAWAGRIASVRDENEQWSVIGRSRDELYRAFGPMILGVMLAAPLLLRVLAPATFRPASLLPVVLLVLTSGVPVIGALASGRALITSRRTKPIAIAAGVAAAVNIGLNVIMVPWLGLGGAAGATLIAFTLQAVIQRLLLPRGRRWPRTPASVVVVLTCCVAIAASSAYLPQDAAWIAARAFAAILCLPWLLICLQRARLGATSRNGRHYKVRGGRHAA